MNNKTIDWGELIVGILFIIGGIVALLNPLNALTTMAFVFAFLLVSRGIANIARYFRIQKAFGMAIGISVVVGVLDIILGIMVFANLGAGIASLTFIFSIWFIVDCITNFTHLEVIKNENKALYWIYIIINIIGLILGISMIFNPAMGAATLAYFVGVYLLIFGCMAIALSFTKVGHK